MFELLTLVHYVKFVMLHEKRYYTYCITLEFLHENSMIIKYFSKILLFQCLLIHIVDSMELSLQPPTILDAFSKMNEVIIDVHEHYCFNPDPNNVKQSSTVDLEGLHEIQSWFNKEIHFNNPLHTLQHNQKILQSLLKIMPTIMHYFLNSSDEKCTMVEEWNILFNNMLTLENASCFSDTIGSLCNYYAKITTEALTYIQEQENIFNDTANLYAKDSLFKINHKEYPLMFIARYKVLYQDIIAQIDEDSMF